MLQAVIPALIGGLFTIFSVLIGKRFITNPLHTIKVKQEIIGNLPDGPIKYKMQHKLEAETYWALEHGESYTTCRALIFWAVASLALLIIAGSVVLLMYICLPIDLMTANPGYTDTSIQAETLFQLILDLLNWTYSMLIIPVTIGGLGFASISLCRTIQTKAILNEVLEANKRPWRHIRSDNTSR